MWFINFFINSSDDQNICLVESKCFSYIGQMVVHSNCLDHFRIILVLTLLPTIYLRGTHSIICIKEAHIQNERSLAARVSLWRLLDGNVEECVKNHKFIKRNRTLYFSRSKIVKNCL